MAATVPGAAVGHAGRRGSREDLPDALATLGEWLPYGAGIEALSAAWQGAPVDALHLGVLAVTAIVAGTFAVTCFRWGQD